MSAGVRRVRDICRGLASTGGEVTIIVPNHFGQTQDSDEDFNVRSVGLYQQKPSYRSRWQFWTGVVNTVRELGADFTLFYDTSIDSIRAMRQLKQRGFRVGFELCDFHSTYQVSPIKKAAYSLSERLLPRQSDLTIVITHHISNWVSSVAPGTRQLLIPGLCDTKTFVRSDSAASQFRRDHKISPETVLVSYAGSWWKPKGIAALIDAFDEARRISSVPIMLLVAGRYTGSVLEDDIEAIVNDRNMQKYVLLPGFLNSEQMVGLLSSSDIVVSPSLDHPFNHAAFPTKVAEYAATGCAILATSVGDIPHYFKNGVNAVLCDPHQASSMAAGIVQLAENRILRERLGQAAIETTRQNFDYRSCGQRIDSAIRSLIGKRECA